MTRAESEQRARFIIKLRDQKHKTFEQIGAYYGFSKQAAYKIYKRQKDRDEASRRQTVHG